MSKVFLSEQICKEVFETYAEANGLKQGLEDGGKFGGRKGFLLGVYVRDLPFVPSKSYTEPIFVVKFGDLGRNSDLYWANIISKTELCHRTQMSLDNLHREAPYLLEEGDIIWLGASYHNGIVVAVSGLSQHDDQIVSQEVLNALIVASKRAYRSFEAKPGQKEF